MKSARWRVFTRGSLCALLATQLSILSVLISIGIFAGTLTNCKSSSKEAANRSATNGTVEASRDTLELVFTYGSEKEKWITEDLRAPGGKRIFVRAIPMGSGECIDEVLGGSRQPHIISPASAAFIKLGNAQSQSKLGKDLIGSTENLVLSPVVIAMWKPMAEAMGWGKKPIGWSDILALSP